MCNLIDTHLWYSIINCYFLISNQLLYRKKHLFFDSLNFFTFFCTKLTDILEIIFWAENMLFFIFFFRKIESFKFLLPFLSSLLIQIIFWNPLINEVWILKNFYLNYFFYTLCANENQFLWNGINFADFLTLRKLQTFFCDRITIIFAI
jgi:hypothetical protein